MKDKLNLTERSAIIMHGIFDRHVYDHVKNQNEKHIVILEGRPSLDAARFSSYKLNKRGIKPVVIADNMAGFLFYRNLVKEVWLGYQTTEADGGLCHIGSLILAILAKKHNVPVYLYPAKPQSRFLGSPKEILLFNGVKVAPNRIKGYVPLVDWVSSKYITKIFEPALTI